MKQHPDVIVVGAGIVGLAHAYMAAVRGLKVLVVERDHQCVGASIRNFGFITVTGQPAGATWQRAKFSRDVWAGIAAAARIQVEHHGLWVIARRKLAAAVLEAFMRTPMAEGNELLTPEGAKRRAPELRTDGTAAVMFSPHELRVESRTAIGQLTHWLQQNHGVEFLFGECVHEVCTPTVRTAARTLHAERVVICPGTELNGVAHSAISHLKLQLTRLQMLRIRPQPGLRLPGAVMGDLSLVRYGGYANLPESSALLEQLRNEEGESLDAGIHLIVVQSADGSLVIGDSHHTSSSPEPFASEAVDDLILRHAREAVHLDSSSVIERWTGVYPTGADRDCVILAPDAATRVVIVTSGTGASTGFGIAQEVFDGW